MADLSITASAVIAGADSVQESGTFGATVTPAQAVYRDTDGTLKLADSNGASSLIRTPIGLALHGGSASQPARIHKSGDLTVGSILTPGVAYYLSDTPGGICPYADLASGEYPTFIGIAKSASVLKVMITPSGVAL
jgi:hypothetical protein